MKMADMKLPKKTKTEMEAKPAIQDEGDRWPYGLRLTFDAEQIAKLPYLTKLSVGDPVSVQATGEVTSVRMSERTNGKPDHNIEIQLQQVGCEGTKQGEKESMMDAMRNVKSGRHL